MATPRRDGVDGPGETPDELLDDALLAAARRGERAAQDVLLRDLLPLLRVHAARRLDDRLLGRVAPSDLVQVTLLEAASGFADFAGRTRPELRAWLLRILRTNFLDELKAHLARKRGAGLGRSLDELLASTASGKLASPGTSPSRQVARRQELDLLGARIAELPLAQQEALRLRVIEGLSVKEMARVMGRSEDAVAGLLKRAVSHARKAGPDGSR